MKHYSECSYCPAKHTSKCSSCTYTDRSRLAAAYRNNDDSFMNSFVIGAVTNSTVAGFVLGGDLLGAALGDFMNDDD